MFSLLFGVILLLASPHQDNNMVIEQEQVTVGQSVPPSDNSIGPGPQGGPKGPPSGFVPLPKNEITPTIARIASSLLGGEFGTTTPFSIGDRRYMARVEPHYHPPPPQGCGTPALPDCNPQSFPKPWGWHKGVTVYKAAPGTQTIEDYVGKSSVSPRMKFLQRLDEFYQELEKD